MDARSIARMVRWARRRAGLTQHELARAVGMPQPSIARIENGSVVPRAGTLITILAATGHDLAVEPREISVDAEAIRRSLVLPVADRTWGALGRRLAANRRSGPFHVLRQLRRAGVPFVLLGDLAEVAHGSPTPATLDGTVEVRHSQTDEAADRLAEALSALRGSRTAMRRLHLLTETAAGDDYDALAPNAVPMLVTAGIQVRVAALDDLVGIRRARGTPADRAAATMLRAVGAAPPVDRITG